ncbi:MAG: cytochrome c3 family protein [Candidatus Firestonebacteria bacterium]
MNLLSFLGIEISPDKKWYISFKKRFFKLIGLLLILLVVILLGLAKYSTTPSFCKSCHIMKPYYDAWKNSKHNNVACVECHYPPGEPKTILWKKFQALSQVAKYVTRTYSSKPYAEIEDTSCLRVGCHSTRLLEGKITTKKGIMFNHRHHLTEERRGRHLRCTSCHSQMVVGKHVEVTWDTCYLCHFKGKKTARDINPIGGCISCHKVPETDFTIGNIVYNHKNFVSAKGKDVSCKKCHLDVIQGDGEAPQERCYTCHNQPEKLQKYNDLKFIHEQHITKRNVACFHCHKEMRHSITTISKKEMTSLNCAKCHTDKHTGVQQIYKGIGAKGVPDMPSAMYLANVDCVGCHISEQIHGNTKFDGSTYKYKEDACVKCHGEKYTGLVLEWKKILNDALDEINSKSKIAEDLVKSIPKNSTDFNNANTLLSDVRYNIQFISEKRGLHNIYYSVQILQVANKSLDKIGNLLKKELPSMNENILINGRFCMTMCHSKLNIKIPSETVKYGNKIMPHLKHLEAGLDCISCHEFGQHKDVRLKMSKKECRQCHEL